MRAMVRKNFGKKKNDVIAELRHFVARRRPSFITQALVQTKLDTKDE